MRKSLICTVVFVCFGAVISALVTVSNNINGKETLDMGNNIKITTEEENNNGETVVEEQYKETTLILGQ